MDKQQIAQYIKDGMPYADIAKKCNVSTSAVNRVAFEHGIQRIPREKPYVRLTGAQIDTLRLDTAPARDLANKYNVSIATIYKHKDSNKLLPFESQEVKLSNFAKNIVEGIFGRNYTTTLTLEEIQDKCEIIHDYGHCRIYRRIMP